MSIANMILQVFCIVIFCVVFMKYIIKDAGETIPVHLADDQFNTAAAEAVRPFLFEILDFISDLHVLAKIKVSPHLIIK